MRLLPVEGATGRFRSSGRSVQLVSFVGDTRILLVLFLDNGDEREIPLTDWYNEVEVDM